MIKIRINSNYLFEDTPNTQDVQTQNQENTNQNVNQENTDNTTQNTSTQNNTAQNEQQIDFKEIITNVNKYYVSLITSLKNACTTEALFKDIPQLKPLADNAQTSNIITNLRNASTTFTGIADKTKVDEPKSIADTFSAYASYLTAINNFQNSLLELANKQQ